MEIFLLTLVVFTVSLQNVVKKAFGARHNANAVFSFAMGSVLAAAAVFLVTAGGELHFTFDTVGYSLLFATAYGISTVGSFLAIATGPLSVSSLLIQLSLIIPTLYGILFRHDQEYCRFVFNKGFCVNFTIKAQYLFHFRIKEAF